MKLNKNQLWKSLPADMKPHGHQFKIGEWNKVKGKVAVCENGFHGSRRIIDAMQYVDMEVLALCEVQGETDSDNNKECWQEMKILKAWKWEKKDSVELAIFAAEQVIDIYEKEYPKDKRPREALEAAKNWLKNPSDEAARAARAAGAAGAAAEAAAGAAARAAWAAGAAAEAAARAARAARAAGAAGAAAEAAAGAAAEAAWAAGGAAEAAAGAAWAAGADKILDKCEAHIHKNIKLLKEIS
jgi:hypothetical protein